MFVWSAHRFVMKWSGDIEGDRIIGEWITPDDADQDAYDDAMDDDTFVAVRTHNDISRLRWVQGRPAPADIGAGSANPILCGGTEFRRVPRWSGYGGR
jgi:hypothetical protein